ncbi:MAG: methyl-accepting chemotaxis protein [Sphingomonadales bacterium]
MTDVRPDAAPRAQPAAPNGVDPRTINAAARNCGILAVECSDVSGFVSGVADSIARNLRTLDRLEAVTGQLLEDQARVAGSAGEARLLTDRARETLTGGEKAVTESARGFGELTELIAGLGERMSGFAEAMEQVRSVSGAIDAIARKTNMLALNATIEAARAGPAGRSFMVVAAEVKKLAEETRVATTQIAETVRSLGDEAGVVAADIRAGVLRSHDARAALAAIQATVGDVASLVGLLDAQSDEVAGSARQIEQSAESVKTCLDSFAGDARANGGRLDEAQLRLARLEALSGTMLNQLANCGVRIDDSAFIDIARDANAEIEQLIEASIARGEIAAGAVFDTDYRPVDGTNPRQYLNRFCDFADRRIRPVLDRVTAADPRHIGCVISDMNGYLPTHISRRSRPQGDDPAWNAEHCRNRCNYIDDALRRAIASDADFMLVTYRMDFSDGRYLPVKNVFVPTYVNGRRWGNFELAYRD